MASNIKNLRSEFDRLSLELSLIEDILATPPYADVPLEECLRHWLVLVADYVSADFAQSWHYEMLQGKESGHLTCSGKIVLRAENAPKVRSASMHMHTSEVRGLPARAVKSNQLVYVSEIKKSMKLVRFDVMMEENMKSAVLLPIKTAPNSTHIFELFFNRVDPLDAPTIDLLRKLSRIFRNFLGFARRGNENLYEETEYAILLDAVPAMVWYKDRHNRILAINSYAAEVTGMPIEQIVGRHTEEVYPKPDAAKYYQDDLEVIRSGKPKRRIIEEIRGRNDERIWVSTDKVPYVKHGQVEGIIVFATDVSELKQKEEELLKIKYELESTVEERTKELATVNFFFTLSRELLCIADTRGYFTRLNPVWTERLGYSLEELYSRPYIDFVHEDDRARTEAISRQIAKGDHIRDFENRYRAKDGTYRHFRWSASAFGEFVFAVAYDITDRKKVEEELIDINERFTNIGKHMPGIVYQFLITTDGKFSFPYVSEGCVDLLGYEKHEIEADGSLAFAVMHPEDSEAMMRLSLQSAKNMTLFSYEGRVMATDGSIRYIRATSTPEKLQNGDVLFNGLVMDVTDLKRAQEEVRKLNIDLEERVDSLRKANEDLNFLTRELEKAYDQALEASKLKSEFVANISHEIRTPLSAVIGTTDLLLDTALDAQQREYAGTARDSAKSLLTIINDILDFSKIEAGKIELESIDFELQNIVEGSVDLFLKDAAAKKLALITYVDPVLPGIVTGDPVRLRQVLINLVSNAVKFTQKGEVVVRVVPFTCEESPDNLDGDPEFVRFEVHDTGIGMPENVRQRLFTPFVQADGSTTRKFGGTGLGLSICKRLADLMEGEIGFESTEGRGTLFWFTVPLPAAHSIARLRSPVSAEKKDGLVVLCGGSLSIQSVVSSYIEDEGHEVLCATGLGGMLYSLDAAVAEGKTVAAVIVDGGNQPDEAIFAVDAIRRDSRYKNVKVIFMTDVHERETGQIACERGADLCVYKPFRRTDLLSAVFHRQRESGSTVQGLQDRIASKRKVTETIRVLVVEDNTLMRGLTVKQLEKFGIETDFATNGAEAVDKTFTNDYSMVLMDCQMPVMDGFEATLEIRKREFVKGGRVPIIAMTAYAMAGDREQCIASGMDDYLSKPVTIDQLESMLERWVSDVFTPNLQLSHSGSALADGGVKKSKIQNSELAAVSEDEVLQTTAPADETPLLDIQQVIDHYGRNSLQEILSSFIDELEELVPSIVSEVKGGDIEMVGRLAHQLKGLVAVLSCSQMSEIALALEQACREGRSNDIARQTKQLVRAKKELVNFINKFLATN